MSKLYEASEDFAVTLDYYGFRGKDEQPDTGSYLVDSQPNRRPTQTNVVGAQDGDFLTSDTDTGTPRLRWNLSPDVTLNSRTRYAETNNAYAFWSSQYNANARAANIATHTRWQDIKYFAHQDNLRWDTNLFGRKNEFVFTLEYTDHHVDQGTFSAANAGAFNCRTTANPAVWAEQRVLRDDAGRWLRRRGRGERQRTHSHHVDAAGQNYDWNVKTAGRQRDGHRRLHRSLHRLRRRARRSRPGLHGQDVEPDDGRDHGHVRVRGHAPQWLGGAQLQGGAGRASSTPPSAPDRTSTAASPTRARPQATAVSITVTGVGVVTSADPETSKNWELGTSGTCSITCCLPPQRCFAPPRAM